MNGATEILSSNGFDSCGKTLLIRSSADVDAGQGRDFIVRSAVFERVPEKEVLAETTVTT